MVRTERSSRWEKTNKFLFNFQPLLFFDTILLDEKICALLLLWGSGMQAIEQYLVKIFTFFTTNWIAAAILAVIIIAAAVKKPKELFKVAALITLLVGVFYVMMFLEQSMFSGVSSGQKAYNEEARTGGKEL